jgi:hypothetical protein
MNPGRLRVAQPSRGESLGLAIPQSLLARADHLIE